jgi:hypothetical protein
MDENCPPGEEPKLETDALTCSPGEPAPFGLIAAWRLVRSKRKKRTSADPF